MKLASQDACADEGRAIDQSVFRLPFLLSSYLASKTKKNLEEKLLNKVHFSIKICTLQCMGNILHLMLLRNDGIICSSPECSNKIT